MLFDSQLQLYNKDMKLKSFKWVKPLIVKV